MSLWIPAGAVAVTLLALAMIFASYRLATRERWMAAAFAVGVAALLLRGYAVSERALNPWDERYHALVAKHLVERPWVPTLYRDPALPYDYTDWYSNHIWLHKPPLALWSQAVSMRVFGVAEMPMRLPSLVFGTASVLVTFGIGCLLFSPSVGLTAAVFHAFNGFLVDLGLGRRASDHVDTLLILLVALGILGALAADRRWPRATGVVLGLACGLAFLTKSLPGILLLPIWFLVRWQLSSRRGVTRELATAGGVALLVAIPWTLYVWIAFPVEAQHESAYTWRHVTDVLENHGGPPWRYVVDMPRFFGELIYLPLAVAILSAWRGSASSPLRAMLLWVAVPYALFSIMATKMPGYIALAAPAIFLIQADVWLAIQRQWHQAARSWRKVAVGFALVVLALSPARHLLSPTGPLERRDRDPLWAQDLRDLNRMIGNEKAVIFNVATPIEAMFYTPYVVYEYLPTGAQLESLRDRGYAVYIYRARTAGAGPTLERIATTPHISS